MSFQGTLLGLVMLICAIWVIVEVVTKHKNWTSGKKVLWIVCALVFNVITALIYYFVEYKK